MRFLESPLEQGDSEVRDMIVFALSQAASGKLKPRSGLGLKSVRSGLGAP
jgi:hypothetical protein